MASSKVPIIISLKKQGVKPPVFIAGTYSIPQWKPEEMVATPVENGEYIFKAEVSAVSGTRLQYKFQAKEGEWFLDENVESVTDHRGHRNNVVDVPQKPATNNQQPTPKIRLPENQAPTGSNTSLGISSDWLNVDPFSRKGRVMVEDDYDSPHDRIPLFAHECFLPNDHYEVVTRCPFSPTEMHPAPMVPEPDKYDLEDPNLEKFPSGIDQISELIHEVEAAMEEDETDVAGVPPSAVLGMPRSRTNDIVGEFIGGSPATSPILTKTPKRLEAPRGSATSDLSLRSIAEGAEEDGDDSYIGGSVVMLSNPFSRLKVANRSLSSDDDEAVALESPKGKYPFRTGAASSPMAHISEYKQPMHTVGPSPQVVGESLMPYEQALRASPAVGESAISPALESPNLDLGVRLPTGPSKLSHIHTHPAKQGEMV